MTTEDKLFARYCNNGDEKSLEKLILSAKPWLLRLLFRIVGDSNVAYDLMQDTWIIVIRQCNSFNPKKGKINNYIYTIAKNEALRWKNSNSDFNGTDGLPRYRNNDFPGVNDDTPEKIVIMKEKCDGVRNAILKLQKDYQDVILLFHFAALNINEIAEMLGKPVGTIKSLLQRGRLKLKLILPEFIKNEYISE